MKHSNSLFEEPWWLDAVASGAWREVCVVNNGDVQARLPFTYMKTSSGLRIISTPPLTQTSGPWLNITAQKPGRILEQQKKLMNGLISNLPVYDELHLRLHPNVKNWLPFYWRGFSQSTRYTYIIQDLTDLDAVWKQFDDRVRNSIRKAKSILSVHEEVGIDTLYDLVKGTYGRKGMEQPISKELMQRVVDAAVERGQGMVLSAKCPKGNIHAASFVAWDERSAYYLLGGVAPDHKAGGAQALLLWEFMKRLQNKTRCFDFEGSMNPQIEKFFRGFGAQQIPYHAIEHVSPQIMAMQSLSNALQGVRQHPSVVLRILRSALRKLFAITKR